MRAVVAVVGLAAVVVGVLAESASGQAGVIGADLRRPANAAYGCEALPSTDAFGGRLFLPTGAATCTYLATGGLASQAEVPQARFPGGVVTAVRVKAGPVVGPLQVTVLRTNRGGLGFQCCYWAAQSQVFTPAPNTITQVGVRLPMRADLDPQVGETVDYLGLTVLAPGVPIPMHEIGNPGDPNNPGALAWFNHVAPGQERADGAGVGGVVPLLNADFVPLCQGRVVGARAAQAGPCLPGIAARGNRAAVRGGRALLTLVCNVAFPCQGRLRLQPRSRGGTVLGSAPVAIDPGAQGALRVRLTRAGRRAVGRRVWLNVRLALPDGREAIVSTRVRLRR